MSTNPNKLITADSLAHLEANYLPFITDPTNHNIITKTANNNIFITEDTPNASNNLVLGEKNKLTASHRNLVGGNQHDIEYTYKTIIAGEDCQVKGQASAAGGDNKSIYSSAVLGEQNVLQTGSHQIASAFLLGDNLILKNNTNTLNGCLITGRYNTVSLATNDKVEDLLFAVGGGEDNTHRSNKLDITLNNTRIFNNNITLNSNSGLINISTNEGAGVVQLRGCVQISARNAQDEGRIYIGANWNSNVTEGNNAILVLGNGQNSNNSHNAIEIVQRLSSSGTYPIYVNERLKINEGMDVSGTSVLKGELKVDTIKANTSTVISLGTKSINTSDGLTYITPVNDYNLANGFAQYSTPSGFLTNNAFYSIRIEGDVNFTSVTREKVIATGTFQCTASGLYSIPAIDQNFGPGEDSKSKSVGGSVVFNIASDLNSIQVFFEYPYTYM